MEIIKNKNGITFQVEELEPPTELVEEKDINEVLKDLGGDIHHSCLLPSKIISFGYHSFLNGMYKAYAEHRPFTLSPDAIWLLIIQGVAQHINFTKGTSDDLFPHIEHQKLTAQIVLNDDKSIPWDKAIHQFPDLISNHVGKELVDLMKCDFSTTTEVEKIVSEITIMDAMKAYFEYEVLMYVCGIPQITLEGCEDDWIHILKKARALKKYGLSWWVEILEPILEQFIEAFRGNIDTEFWMNMFKVHTHKEYGNPKSIDGWIISFFPYDKSGNKMDLKSLWGIDIDTVFKTLPKEISCVDFTLRVTDTMGNIISVNELTFWTGFIGLTQKTNQFTLRPTIGWFIGNKLLNISNESNSKKLSDSRKYYLLDDFPSELFEINNLKMITLYFRNEIKIPEKAFKVNILMMHGKINENTLLHLKELFINQDTTLYVNDELILRREQKNVDIKHQKLFWFKRILNLFK